jgi:oligopeptidase B
MPCPSSSGLSIDVAAISIAPEARSSRGKSTMKRNQQITLLLDDLLHERLNRREAMRRAAKLGLTLPALAALLSRAELALARQDASPVASPVAAGPPDAEQIPSTREFGGREIVDPYAWLEDPTDPRVIAYLEAENAYADAMLAPTRDLQDALVEEFIARIPQTDESVPTQIDDWFYYDRIEEGQNYPIIARRKGSIEAPEEILLDLNEMAGEFLSLGAWDPSPDHRYFAYTINETGGIDYSLYILDTQEGVLLDDHLPLADGFAWVNDNATLYYTLPDAALRPYQLYRHALGTDPASDELLFTENDEIYGIYLFKTNDREYIFLTSYSYGTTEAQYLDADDPAANLQMLAPRRDGIEVYPDHGAQGFLLLTNEDAVNFRLMVAPVENPERASWTDLIPPREERLLDAFDVLQDYLGVYGRENGFTQIWIYDIAADSLDPVTFDEEVYTAGPGSNRRYEATTLQITYTSMVTPSTVYEIDLETGERTILKQDEVLTGHDPADYVSERLFAVGDDGTEIPISLVYRADKKISGPMPLRLDGYGSYGINYDPAFSAFRLSLIDRGVIYAIAHVRGGSELGRPWYDDGKLLHKKNTFTDFIACANHLSAEGYTSTDHLLAYGGSAGGLLLGAVANMAPDRFHAIVAEVPFVDVLRVMLDPSLPLTTGEYVEWGNPEEEVYYDYIKSYSPYDNVTAQAYPTLMITAGINDDQVPYWQPAKWTAKLRDMKTDDNMLLLKTNMGAGHSGQSARDEAYRETAFLYAFMLYHFGLAG